MAVRGYTSPGVSVQETISPALAPLLANPSVIAVVGAASGAQTATERVLLTGVTPVTLKYTGVNNGTVVVRSTVDNSVINPGAYLVATGADPDPTVAGDAPSTITLSPPPATAPVVSNAGVGTLTGIYVYAVSFVNPRGETAVGPVSAQTTFTASGANLSAIVVDPNVAVTGTTGRNIYRAKVTSGVQGSLTLVATIGNNSATTLTNETTDDVTAAAAASPKVGLQTGDSAIVTYSFTDQHYYEPTFFDDFDDIADKYGAPFDANGNISSPLSFAARLAFQNGASEIVTLASLTGGDSDLSSALSKLEAEDSVRIVTVVSGSASVHSALAAHLANMNTQGNYRQGIVGRDGSSTAVTADTLRLAAKGYNNEALILVSPASFQMPNPITGRTMLVGGQYAAAGVAGMFAARDVQIPLTRKTLAGFVGLGDKRTASELSIDSQSGLFAVLNSGGVLQVRHGVTTAVSNVNTAEASVVRAKYEMGHRLRDTLDGSIVGNVLPVNEAPLIVGNVVTGVLEQLVVEGSISRYANVKARILESDATTIEVKFEYRPAFPINNVIVRFTINTATGATDLTTA